MFFWPEQDLDRLPAYEAFLCEGGDGGGREVVAGRLKCVLASYRSVDPGDRGRGDFDEERCAMASLASCALMRWLGRRTIVVASYSLVEGC